MDPNSWLLIVAGVLFVLSVSWNRGGGEQSQRLKRIERKVDLLLRHLQLDSDQGVDPKVLELMQAGRKIEAIKLYREQTGVGLKEAKDYVEGL